MVTHLHVVAADSSAAEPAPLGVRPVSRPSLLRMGSLARTAVAASAIAFVWAAIGLALA